MCCILTVLFLKFTGDIEKKYHLGVSPLCDRQTESIANIQIGNYAHLVASGLKKKNHSFWFS